MNQESDVSPVPLIGPSLWSMLQKEVFSLSPCKAKMFIPTVS